MSHDLCSPLSWLNHSLHIHLSSPLPPAHVGAVKVIGGVPSPHASAAVPIAQARRDGLTGLLSCSNLGLQLGSALVDDLQLG